MTSTRQKLMSALVPLSAAIFAAGCSSPGDQSGTTAAAAQTPLTQAQQVQVTGAILNTVANAAGLPVIQLPSGASGATTKMMKMQLDPNNAHLRDSTSFSVTTNCDVSGTATINGTISDNGTTSSNYSITANLQVSMQNCVSSDNTEINSPGFTYGLTLSGGSQTTGASTSLTVTYGITLDGPFEVQNASSGIVEQSADMNLTEQLTFAETINSTTGVFSLTATTSINGEISGTNYSGEASNCVIAGNESTSAYTSSGTCNLGF